MFSMLPLVNPGLKAGAWPQDNLQRLKDLAGIPVDQRNKEVVSRDYYGITGSTGFIAPGTTVTKTISPGQDGDFWLNSFGVWAPAPSQVTNPVPIPWGTIQITDNSNGYNLFSPNVRIAFLTGILPERVQPAFVGANFARFKPKPFIRTSLPQPYPLLRDSSFSVTIHIDTTGAVGNRNIFFILDGWKEFQYAS